MALKVPYLSDAQIESATQELLRRYTKWKGAPPRPPIPVDAIVEGVLELTLEVTDLRARLGKDDVLGATWLNDALVVIDQCCRARWLIGSPPGSVILDENVTAERPPRRRRGGTSREEGQKGVSSSGSMLSWTTAAA